MTTFTREALPFRVQASVGSTTPDFEVSTDGTTSLKAATVSVSTLAVANLVASASIRTTRLEVSATVSLGGTVKTALVTVSATVSAVTRAILIVDGAGTSFWVPVLATSGL